MARSTLAALILVILGSAAQAQPTFSRDVSRILQAKCQQCHRPNDIAPFSLLTYQDVSTYAEDIQRVVAARIMPPWKPVEGHGNIKDSFALSEEQRQTILNWIAAGVPEGDPADLPEPLPDTGEWQLGEPDLVLPMPEVFDVPRTKDTYRCFVITTDLPEDKYVSAVQISPGNRKIVHHVLLAMDSTGQGERLDARDEGPGYDCFGGIGIEVESATALLLDQVGGLGGWVPGTRVRPLTDGVAIWLQKSAKIIMQVHYFPNGRPGPDQTKIGLYFSKKPVERRLRYIPVVNTTFRIPPGEAAHEVTASYRVPFPFDAHAHQVAPHMHLLGRKIRLELEKSGGSKESMIFIDDWDFNWQGFYNYAEPVALPAGSTVRLTCHFDNTADNPRNPSNPLKVVGWGEGTEDEMCLAFLGITLDRENLVSTQSLRRR